MLASCPQCPGFVPQGAAACPHCGAQARREPSRAARMGASITKLGGAAAMAVTLMACYGAPGGPWDAQCWDDVDCFDGEVCDGGICVLAEDCDNGWDDDGDGLTDGDDEDCPEPSTEICGDGLDNDGDLAVDCQDPDCSAFCIEDCTNGVDDDADDLIDCQDTASCATCPVSEVECGNLFDDDQDGLTDCDDPDCDAVCSPSSCGDGVLADLEQCDDGALVGGDGCSAECSVELDVFCPLVPGLELGDNAGDSSAGTNAFVGSCEGIGRESLYSFTAAAAGTLFLQVSGSHDHVISVMPACDPTTTELSCVNGAGVGAQELTSVPLAADQTVYVVADSALEAEGGPFVLTASFVEQ